MTRYVDEKATAASFAAANEQAAQNWERAQAAREMMRQNERRAAAEKAERKAKRDAKRAR